MASSEVNSCEVRPDYLARYDVTVMVTNVILRSLGDPWQLEARIFLD